MKKVIRSNEAPAPGGHYSQAIECGEFLFCSGQIGIDPKTSKLIGEDAVSQTKQVLENIKALMISQGMSMGHIVKATVFVTNINDYKVINEMYATYFEHNPPSRSFIQVAALPLGAKVEIEVIAHKD